MIKILLASHGDLADGICSSLEIIMGKQRNIETLCAYKEEDFNLNKEVSKIINEISNEDKLIVITDIFGGSVNNEFMNNIKTKNLYLISGLNLPLVMELTTIKDEENIDSIIKNALDNSKDSIKYCNTILESIEIDDEYF